MPEDLDDADRMLLAAIQADSRIPQASLGARVGLSAAAVNRRLRRLAEAGYITGTPTVLDPELLGSPLTVIAQVEMANGQAGPVQEVRAALLGCPQVQQCYYVTGDCDFIVVFLVRDMPHYIELTRRLFTSNPHIRNFTTLVGLDRVKVSLDVPLE